jgi:hypothetical protein
MKRLLAMLLAVSLAVMPCAAPVGAETSRPGLPPIEQPLVREGDFAVKLANSFGLTGSDDEAAAQDVLGSISISPRNGWIPDYPMTPDIIAEVRGSTARAAAAGSLSMAEAEATGIVDKVCLDMQLAVTVAGDASVRTAGEDRSYGAGGSPDSGLPGSSNFGSEYARGAMPPPPDAGLYDEPPANIEEYYGSNGPPVVTYYPPPWDYYWLYDWVPWPFWWGGFGFGGFFVLGNFNRCCYHGHHCSNFYRNAKGTYNRVNPMTRAQGTSGTAASSRLAGTGGTGSRLNSPNARAGAAAIVSRSTGAAGARAGNTAVASASGAQAGRNPTAGGPGGTSQGASRLATYTNRGATFAGPNSSASASPRSSTAAGPRAGSSSFGGRSFSGAQSSRGFSGGGYRGGFGSGGGFHSGGHGGGGGGHR